MLMDVCEHAGHWPGGLQIMFSLHVFTEYGNFLLKISSQVLMKYLIDHVERSP